MRLIDKQVRPKFPGPVFKLWISICFIWVAIGTQNDLINHNSNVDADKTISNQQFGRPTIGQLAEKY